MSAHGTSGQFSSTPVKPTEAQAIFRELWSVEDARQVHDQLMAIVNDPDHPRHAMILKTLAELFGKGKQEETTAKPPFKRLDE